MRIVGHSLLAIWLLALAMVMPGAARAQPVQDLFAALRMDELLMIVREEGLQNATEILPKLPSGDIAGPVMQAVLDAFDLVGMQADMTEALERRMTPELMRAATDFFTSPPGQGLVDLELSARRAFMDPAIEEMAQASWQKRASQQGDPHVIAIRRFVRINDLITRNAGSTMVARYEYMQGFAEGGGKVIDEDAALTEIWSREADVVAETEDWLMGFMLLAFGPLPAEDIEAYNAFSLRPVGEALNDAIFAGFEATYRRIAFQLGRIAGSTESARDL